jgi:2-keto-4-pentenoate hydratase/2-oxohepta-3-ene-1,7-dioic acid hydratase in catechol pathway
MKLCRFGPVGQEKPGLVDAQGRIRDLSAHIADLTGAEIGAEGLAKLAAIDPASLPLAEGEPRYGVPVKGVGKFIAIGLNYADHAAESNLPIPEEPVVFNKWVNCLQGANDPVTIPRDLLKTDWEVELGVVIGKRASYVEQDEALDYVAGYCTINDVSERAWQTERGGTWDKGKGFPPSDPSAPGWSPPMRWAIRRTCPCGSMSMASGCRTARP